jgi:hypothetical protein
MGSEYIPVPVEAAALIANGYSKRIVVINAWDADHRLMHTTTFGVSPVEKQIAASIGEATAEAAGCALHQKIEHQDFRAEAFARLHTLHPIDTYHEDQGVVMWWLLPVIEPPYVGTPMDDSWPGYHTHWSYLPKIELLTAEDGAVIVEKN